VNGRIGHRIPNLVFYDIGTQGLRMRKTVSFLNRFWSDESGASAAEYVIILAILGSALAFSAFLLGGAISTAINDTATCVNSNGAACI